MSIQHFSVWLFINVRNGKKKKLSMELSLQILSWQNRILFERQRHIGITYILSLRNKLFAHTKKEVFPIKRYKNASIVTIRRKVKYTHIQQIKNQLDGSIPFHTQNKKKNIIRDERKEIHYEFFYFFRFILTKCNVSLTCFHTLSQSNFCYRILDHLRRAYESFFKAKNYSVRMDNLFVDWYATNNFSKRLAFYFKICISESFSHPYTPLLTSVFIILYLLSHRNSQKYFSSIKLVNVWLQQQVHLCTIEIRVFVCECVCAVVNGVFTFNT